MHHRSTRPAWAPVRIASRVSPLAMQQANLVAAALQAQGLLAEIVPFKTIGDRTLDRPLAAVGTKGAFTRELEEALLAGEVDCCVHSLKDLPTQSPDGLTIGAVLPREDPSDVLVTADPGDRTTLELLPPGSRVGTSSPRRRALLAAIRPDLQIVDLRGNVGTRLAKVERGEVVATILAFAGLNRLGLAERASSVLRAPAWLPAPGQGAIAVQIRADDDDTAAFARKLDDEPTRIAVDAERSFLAAFEGGCQLPLGALALPASDGDDWVLHGVIERAETRSLLRGRLTFDAGDALDVGRRLADQLRGARSALAAR